ncbi:unnamed protein product [Macrosiphum euphorbiae]|uniref:C2H2-type domain-containing protein n=1 Tax=Macrosiphum euphorbiae TaxID=13131 RepID=A0AAV0WVF9_9HEMI|nr:unnamed protein product [Macrosiphum euphorbiae]CAI6356733.1 unnamed protein product [Macrosiphum euphorbiae]CAI6359668.1 unnamed protein product [Macrosiphum euphorbiae]CAI6372066.1 unnamed protein product [Macrosiphum euphorbiae]
MFKCEQCPSTFTRKGNLTAHQKNHNGVRFSCTICASTFGYKTHLNRHMKNVHGVVNVPAQRQPAQQSVTRPTPQGHIQIAPGIFVPDVPAGGSNAASDDDIICMKAMDEFENTG